MHRRGFDVTQFSKSLVPAKALGLSFAAACLAGTALVSPARAQDNGGALPAINVDATRLVGTGGNAGNTGAPANTIGIVGASTTVITKEDIARAPNQTIQEIIATAPGVQLTNLYGAVNGAGSVVDLRGFGAFASSNTLILVNGRRLNEADLQGVDLSTIPIQSIERIEITRGNSGAVLYGDNAVGGVINIVTKTGVGLGKPYGGRIEGGVGSYGQREGNASFSTNHGPWSTAVFGNAIHSDGYRANNKLNQQNGVGDIRYTTQDFSAFLNLSGDNQQLGFPGGRGNMYQVVFGAPIVNELLDPRGTHTPNDYGRKQGVNATAGFTKSLWAGAELIVDGGVRNKKQQAGFFGDPAWTPSFPGDVAPFSYVDSNLTTWSITPRLSMKNMFGSVTSNILTGIDYYDSRYSSNRQYTISDPPNHVYSLSQQTIAGYWQQTLGLLPSTDFSYGGRLQQLHLKARDVYDPTAPAGSLIAQATPLDKDEINHALHVGLEHRFNENFAVFGRAARAFRTPNVDERVVTGPAFDCSVFPCVGIPQNFQLKTQTSYDVEGGVRIHGGPLDIQTSYYDMHLKNEIHYNAATFFNYNLDPTHRYGSETQASLRINEAFRIRGGFAYTRAVFEEGPNTGKDVPLVSRLSGSAGFTWNIWQKYAVLDASARFWSSRRLDNDQANTQSLIGANATIDLKLSGEVDRFFWSASVINLLDAQYNDYGVASAFTAGSFSAYPLPGRMFLVKAGMTF
ncbi:MAG: TonB-dependent receptor [Candidatus Afipia apatlaquensis]|uniref:TonB-dependent receptor n=1 Tax=Candidatus Afipia apatlaquensis TaxID=2712852 RepID=A0A7C9RDJ1_9BRAD|nr:TonB-dependent receptor [Candidatus Afipia apatlaquensis]